MASVVSANHAERLHRIRVHIKQRRYAAAQDALAALPAELDGAADTHLLQIELLRRQNRIEDAAAYAATYEDWAEISPRLAESAMEVLAAADQPAVALDLAAMVEDDERVARKATSLARQEVERILAAFDRQGAAALNELTGPMLDEDRHRKMVLRHIVLRARRDDDLELLAEALRRVVAARPDFVHERLQLLAALRRLGRTDEAFAVAEGFPADSLSERDVEVERLRAASAAQREEIAADRAEVLMRRNRLDKAERRLIRSALVKAGRLAAAERFLDDDARPDERRAIMLGKAREAFDDGDADRAEALAHSILEREPDQPGAQALLAKIALARMDREAAERVLRKAQRAEPDNLQLRVRLAEVLIARGAADETVALVEGPAVERPDQPLLSVLAGRAERMRGDFDAAADHFERALATAPDDVTLLRQAASANSQAGRQSRAAQLLGQSVAQRESRMPATFDAGMDGLDDRIGEVEIPPGRFDWAYRFYDGDAGRDEWERRAKWGFLADRLLFDWIEVRTGDADQAMSHFVGLDDFERDIEALTDAGAGKPPLLTTAHVGPLFGGAVALELLGVKAKWLASTPSVGDDLYQEMLISTSDQTEVQVARATAKALASGYAVGMAVDGAPNMNAPRIAFEGREVTYSTFAARMAFRQKLGSCYAAPRWEERKLRMHVHVLPMPEEGEEQDAFVDRWTAGWLAALRTELAGEPENLRLAGGIWRHIA